MGSNNRQKTKTGRTFVQCRTFSCRGHPLTRSAPKRAVLRQYPAVLNRRRHAKQHHSRRLRAHDLGNHRRPGLQRTRLLRLAEPITPLAVTARLTALQRALVATTRRAAPLDPGRFPALLGAIHMPPVTRPAENNLPLTPLAVEQSSRRAHRPSRERGWTRTQNGSTIHGSSVPRDRLVRVLRRGASQLRPASHRSFS